MQVLDGVSLSKKLLELLHQTEKCFQYCCVLQRVSHFHNEMGAQIFPFHKPMLLKDAEEFEHILMHPVDPFGNRITWDSSTALAAYCKKLEKSMHALAQKNKSTFCPLFLIGISPSLDI